MHKLFYFLLVILPYVPVNGDKELPLVQFYDVVKNLKTTLVAGRSCDTTSWTGTDGTKYVTLKTPNLNNDGDNTMKLFLKRDLIFLTVS